MNPAKLQALFDAAVAHHHAGRLREAEALYRQARVAAPGWSELLQLSGLLAYQEGRIADAIRLLSRAHELDRKSATCEMHLARVLLASGDIAKAEKHLRHVVKQAPGSHEAWNEMARCLLLQGRLTEAVTCHERAITLKPDFGPAWCSYGLTLTQLGRHADALRCHERALAVDPHFAEARFGRAQALHQMDRVAEAVQDYRLFLARQPAHHEARSYLLFALHALETVSREELFAEHVTFGKMVGSPPSQSWPNPPDPARRLKVAVLSPDLREHSCAYFLEPLLAHLDRGEFELYLYHDHYREDAMSARFRALAAVWRNFVGQATAVAEERIRTDAPDILIDLAGHTGMNRLPLLAKRLAPVQITYLGYPDTTGVPAIDYRFTDAFADPPGAADGLATERLIRFAPCGWTYAPPANAPDPAPRSAGECDPVVFGSFNHLGKIGEGVLELWSRILTVVPNSRLMLKGGGFSDPAMIERYRERLACHEIPAARVDLIERAPDLVSHLRLYHSVDVALDSFPYNGTTTTCEALWMGVPVITLAGDRHMSRVGVSLLNAAGHPEWVAKSLDEYVRIATQLAGDKARRDTLRRSLRESLRGGALLDHTGQALRFGAALRACWREWCGRAVADENP